MSRGRRHGMITMTLGTYTREAWVMRRAGSTCRVCQRRGREGGGVSEHDDGLIVRGDAGYDKNGFESAESIAREERGDLERGLGR